MYLDKRTNLDKSQECDSPVGTVIIWSSHLSLCCGPQMITHFLAPFQKKKKKGLVRRLHTVDRCVSVSYLLWVRKAQALDQNQVSVHLDHCIVTVGKHPLASPNL